MSQLPRLNMTVVWSAAVLVTLVSCVGVTPWDAITELLENRGPSEEQASIVGFVAGYTLPLSAGVAVLAFAFFVGWFDGLKALTTVAIVCAVLAGAGVVAQEAGLGLLPDTSSLRPVSGPWYAAIPAYIFQAYFNAYGWALMLSAIAIGGAAGTQGAVWLSDDPAAA